MTSAPQAPGGMQPQSWTIGVGPPTQARRRNVTESRSGTTGEDVMGLQSWKAVQTLLDETANADRQDEERARRSLDVGGGGMYGDSTCQAIDVGTRQRPGGPSGSYLSPGQHTPTDSPSRSGFIFGGSHWMDKSPSRNTLPNSQQHSGDRSGLRQDRLLHRRVTPKTSLLSVFSPLQRQSRDVHQAGYVPSSSSAASDSLAGSPTPQTAHGRGELSYFHSGQLRRNDDDSYLGAPHYAASPEGVLSASPPSIPIAFPAELSPSEQQSRAELAQMSSSGDEGDVDEGLRRQITGERTSLSDASICSGSTIRPVPHAAPRQSPHKRESTEPVEEARIGNKAGLEVGLGVARRISLALNQVTHPPVWIRQVLKCSLAYLIASSFTFVPILAASLSTSSETDVHGRVIKKPAYSAHMVATVMVYFHPARSQGEMILASKFCFILAGLAAVLCTLSIFTLSLFDHFFPEQDSLGEEFGGWAVLVLWVGGGMGLLAWLKLRVGNPNFNTGCSMAAVTIFTVIIKEGGFGKLTEVLLIVAIGATISNIVCFTLWPVSATSQLEASIKNTLESFSTLLGLLSATFLLDRPPSDTTQASLDQAVKAHANSFVKLKADLNSAKRESIIDKRIGSARQERFSAVIDSLTRLAQHLTGLRGGVVMQADLLRESVASDEDTTSPSAMGTDELSTSISDMFFDFRDAVGPSLRTLTSGCCSALGSTATVLIDQPTDLSVVVRELDTSLAAFRSASSDVVSGLFNRFSASGHISGLGSVHTDATDVQHDPLDQDGAAAETLFLLYFFLFTFEEFARETLALIEGLQALTESLVSTSTTTWLWSRLGRRQNESHGSRHAKKGLARRLATIVPLDPSETQPRLVPSKRKELDKGFSANPAVQLRGNARFWQRVWAFQERLRQPDIKYAIKTGLGSIILASPAFIERFRTTFLEFRGEWALIAFFASMSPSIGATNILSAYRVAGTIFGAVVAVGIYTLFPDNPIALPIFGCLFSMPCFWVVTQRPQYQQASRFVLLTYNLTCLYAYNQRDSSLSAFEIGWRRSVSVVGGVLWAGFVSAYWWPYAARKELRVGLSDFCIDLSYLYSKLVAAYSGRHEDDHRRLSDTHSGAPETESAALLGPKSSNPAILKEFLSMELHLQIELIKLRGLLAQTVNEPRLKGPFPFATYDGILSSCQNILDKFHSMRCVTTRREWDHHIHKNLVKPVNAQRREMVSNVLLYFYLLAAAFRLRTPLPPALPPAEKSRERLVKAILQLNSSQGQTSTTQDERHWLYFAYALAMQGVIEELQYLGETLQDTFGIIDHSTRGDFDALFV